MNVWPRCKRLARGWLQAGVRWGAAGPAQPLLNQAYLRLGPRGRWHFWRLCSGVFDGPRAGQPAAGAWQVAFAGRRLLMPLAGPDRRLDWVHAVSINGHDIEVKQTYEALLRDERTRPQLFMDIGANFGTHSLLFMAHGVETLTFEPNERCHGWFLAAARANGLRPMLERVALGRAAGEVTLAFPPAATWLGTVRDDLAQRLGSEHGELQLQRVPVRRLDDHLVQVRGRRLLLKIDTEGHELAVLQGAPRLLREAAPRVIFECLDPADREPLFALFEAAGYGVLALPWQPADARPPLARAAFVAAPQTNFIALPPGGAATAPAARP